MKSVKIFLFFCFSSISFVTSAQTLFVNKVNGLIENFPVSAISKLTFSNTDMTVHLQNSTENINLSDIRFLNFEDFSVGIIDFTENTTKNLKIYPNPVNTELRLILNSDVNFEEAHIFIVSVDAKIVLKRTALKSIGSEVIFDVTDLSTGIYLLNFQSDTFNQSYKFIKQ
jgi:hypothetical protein